MNEAITIDGITNPFLKWCALKAVDPIQTRAHMSRGFSFEEACRIYDPSRKIYAVFDGQHRLLKTLCKQMKLPYAICEHCINELGMTIDEVFTDGKENFAGLDIFAEKEPAPRQDMQGSRPKGRREGRKYSIGDGAEYTVKELSEAFQIGIRTLYVRLRKGETIRQAVDIDESERTRRARDHPGNICGSAAESGATSGQAPTRQKRPRKGPDTLKLRANQLCAEYEIDRDWIMSLIKGGRTLDEAVNYVLGYGIDENNSFLLEGGRIAAMRENRDISEEDLAMKANRVEGCAFSRATIHAIETNRRRVTPRELLSLSETLSADPGQLIDLREVLEQLMR